MKPNKQNKMVETKEAKRKNLLKDKRGLSTVEYVILLVLVAVAGIGLWEGFGAKLIEEIGKATTAIPTVPS